MNPDRPQSAAVTAERRTSERTPKVIAAIIACKFLKDKKIFDYLSLDSLRFIPPRHTVNAEHRPVHEPRCQILRAVCGRDEYNSIRAELPRRVRRDVEPAPEGHVGLMAQAVAEDGCPLMTLYEHVPESTKLDEAFSGLEARIREKLR